MFETIRLTPNNGKHYFFGFHDLIATNATNNKLLSLEVDIIKRPPLPSEQAGVGYVDLTTGEYIKLGNSNAYNFPQGARLQWISDTRFIVNNQVGTTWGSDIYDTSSGQKVDELEYTCHCLSKDATFAFGLNYARLHRLGGYGYIGLPDPSVDEVMPKNDGIFKTNLKTKETKVIVSIDAVANCDVATSGDTGMHHYLTHLVLSPCGERIAFLHRFFYQDGGLRTRLMTINVDGSDLRCIASGFLSHFEWKDDTSVFIWGRANRSVDSMRSNPIFSNPLVAPLLSIAKSIARKVLKKSKQMSMSFLLVSDSETKHTEPFGQGIITDDGHPMCNPKDRNIVLSDTYPNEKGIRDLFLYTISENKRKDLDHFKMINDDPEMQEFDSFTSGVDKKILDLMSVRTFSHSRSGLHCDLHPRWSSDGKMAIFDSIHEGTRQIYSIDVTN